MSPAALALPHQDPEGGALSGLSLLLVTSRRSDDGELSQSDEQNGTAEVSLTMNSHPRLFYSQSGK